MKEKERHLIRRCALLFPLKRKSSAVGGDEVLSVPDGNGKDIYKLIGTKDLEKYNVSRTHTQVTLYFLEGKEEGAKTGVTHTSKSRFERKKHKKWISSVFERDPR